MTTPSPPVVTLQLFVAGKLTNPLNGSHGHWRTRHVIAQAWKVRTHVAWLEAGRPTWDGPAQFTFTAYTGKRWDEEEGIAPAVKHVRDAAVRCICDTDDSPASGHRYVYRQEVRPDYRGVLIEVTSR